MKRTLVFVFVTTTLVAQSKPLMLSDAQHMKLQLAQKDAIIANMQLQQAQRQFQTAITAFNNACADIKKENHFADNSICDIDNATITEAKPPAKPEPTQKDTK